MTTALACLAASFVALWGVAHAVPTRPLVASFGAISADNRRVITQEWLAEALTMWFIAGVVLIVTAVAGAAAAVADAIYLACTVMLGAVAVLTLQPKGATNTACALWASLLMTVQPG